MKYIIKEIKENTKEAKKRKEIKEINQFNIIKIKGSNKKIQKYLISRKSQQFNEWF